MKRNSPIPLAVLFGSGAAGLIYQIVWIRHFGRLFGHTAQAAAIVLSAFFCGMGLGYHWAGKRAHRMERPLRAYAIAELVVAVWALAIPYLVAALSQPAQGGWMSNSNSLAQTAVRALAAFALLLPATISLGASFPMVAEHLRSSNRRVIQGYVANTVGAVLGVLVATFCLLPKLGVSNATYVAAALSALCAVAALWSGANKRNSEKNTEARHVRTIDKAPEKPSLQRAWQWTAGISGAATLALQIAYAQLLSLLLRNSTLRASIE